MLAVGFGLTQLLYLLSDIGLGLFTRVLKRTGRLGVEPESESLRTQRYASCARHWLFR